MLKGSKRVYYSESGKRQIVREYESGYYKESLSAKYGIQGSSTLLQWCRKYGILAVEKKKEMKKALEYFIIYFSLDDVNL